MAKSFGQKTDFSFRLIDAEGPGIEPRPAVGT